MEPSQFRPAAAAAPPRRPSRQRVRTRRERVLHVGGHPSGSRRNRHRGGASTSGGACTSGDVGRRVAPFSGRNRCPARRLSAIRSKKGRHIRQSPGSTSLAAGRDAPTARRDSTVAKLNMALVTFTSLKRASLSVCRSGWSPSSPRRRLADGVSACSRRAGSACARIPYAGR
jgi:hypothetical protein